MVSEKIDQGMTMDQKAIGKNYSHRFWWGIGVKNDDICPAFHRWVCVEIENGDICPAFQR